MKPRHRLTSRILLFDRDDRILLFLTAAPDSRGLSRWITPGGGVDDGESHHEAALRELQEETGLELIELGTPVWSHDFVVGWDSADHDTGHAEFYRVTVDHFSPSEEFWTDDERIDVKDSAWWSLDELAASGVDYEPAELIEVARRNIR